MSGVLTTDTMGYINDEKANDCYNALTLPVKPVYLRASTGVKQRVGCRNNTVYIDVTPTHVTEVGAGERPLAQLVIQPVQVGAVKLENLAAVQAEFVRRRGDVFTLPAFDRAGLRQARQFLLGRRADARRR